MVVKIFLGFSVLLGALVIYTIIAIPKNLPVSRSILKRAPAETIFRYVKSPRLMQEWNPFTDGDPSLKMTYTGPEDGVGAASAWEGNSNTGKGQATIVELETNKRISDRLDFQKPFNVTNFGEYRLEPKGVATVFTWTIVESATIPRVISCIVNLDKMNGGQFEKGLKKLKSITESKNKEIKQ